MAVKQRLQAASQGSNQHDTVMQCGVALPGPEDQTLSLCNHSCRGCSLIVAGRLDDDKTFRTMDDVVLPEPLRDLVCCPHLLALLLGVEQKQHYLEDHH